MTIQDRADERTRERIADGELCDKCQRQLVVRYGKPHTCRDCADSPSSALPSVAATPETLRAPLTEQQVADIRERNSHGSFMHPHTAWQCMGLLCATDKQLRADLAEARSLLAEANEERERVHRVHLERHTRLAVALGMDPGYSADATVDEAINRSVQLSEARSRLRDATRDTERLSAEERADLLDALDKARASLRYERHRNDRSSSQDFLTILDAHVERLHKLSEKFAALSGAPTKDEGNA
jgi:hypothetical protein